MWRVIKPLRPHALAVGQAREFCRRRLISVLADDPAYAETVADIAAIASELVTNALLAGSTTISLMLELRADHVRIDVADNAAGLPTPSVPEPDWTRGRGLMIVAALATDWGVTSSPDAKHVWADVALRRDVA